MFQAYDVAPGGQVRGDIRVPGDKSISHRAIMLGALAEGVTEVHGFLEGADALATAQIFRAMGVRIDGPEQGQVKVHGVGLHGLQARPATWTVATRAPRCGSCAAFWPVSASPPGWWAMPACRAAPCGG